MYLWSLLVSDLLTWGKRSLILHMVEAIGLPKCDLCTYCWDGAE